MNPIDLIDAETLYYKNIEHPKMFIEGILSSGLAVLSGDSKIGKSWMVLLFCLKLARGDPVWGMPTVKTGVVYLALEDREWRIQDRLLKLTDAPPENLHFGFSCGKIGRELEAQLEDVIKKYPETGVIFIDTLQMVRENDSGMTNIYAKDYRDLSSLKKLADDHQICVFLVHHTKKERSSNVFNDASGSTAISGVPDTLMILQKEDRFGTDAVLNITGRDVEERQLKLRQAGMEWTVTEELDLYRLKKRPVPDLVHKVAAYLMEHHAFTGTVTDLLEQIGVFGIRPNTASSLLKKYDYEALRPLGIRMEFRKTASARLLTLKLEEAPAGDADDAHDADDGLSGTGTDLPSASAPEEDGWVTVTSPDQIPFPL